MNLKVFHLVFIAASTALAALLCAWCLRRYQEEDGWVTLLGSIASFAAAAGLVGYGFWFVRKARAL